MSETIDPVKGSQGSSAPVTAIATPKNSQVPLEKILSLEPISEPPDTAGVAYSVFTPAEKKLIIVIASACSFFSPMSTAIYLPALNSIASDLRVSNSNINLTVTTYMIMQGLAPTMIGGFSDGAGRRPAYVICFVIYIAANLGLALQTNYPALLVLRCIQSAGSSGTVALSNGVVGDLVTSAERGVYIGYASIGTILGPTLSPIIGGLISQFLGWHWIFWFLVILSVVFFLPLFLFMPETCRKVVGDGSIPPPKLSMSLPSFLRERKRVKLGTALNLAHQEALAKNYRVRFPNPLATLVIFGNIEAAIILFSSGIMLAGLYAVIIAMPSQFAMIYGFNDLQNGLAYIPFGCGGLFAAFTIGKAIDWNYRRHALRLGYPVTRNRQHDLSGFPLETARLQVALPMLYLGAAGMVTFGWVLHFRTSLAGPLILLFLLGYALGGSNQILSILMVDIYPGHPATATAAGNLTRCLLGAGASAVVIPMIDAMGTGWTYTLTSLVWVVYSPCLLLLMKYGPRWRKEKQAKDEKAKAKRNEIRSSDQVKRSHGLD